MMPISTVTRVNKFVFLKKKKGNMRENKMVSLQSKNKAPVAQTAPCCKSKMIRGQQKRLDSISESIVCPDITLIN